MFFLFLGFDKPKWMGLCGDFFFLLNLINGGEGIVGGFFFGDVCCCVVRLSSSLKKCLFVVFLNLLFSRCAGPVDTLPNFSKGKKNDMLIYSM